MKLPNPLDTNPEKQFLAWLEEAQKAQPSDFDAMALATTSHSKQPSVRMVLFKGITPQGIRFFTNYRSRKGEELKKTPRAAVLFFWSTLMRQVRIEGKVKRLTPKESDSYWRTRPRESQLSSSASPQSRTLENPDQLQKEVLKLAQKHEGKEIPRPPHWGGFCLEPTSFEFWIGGTHRLHERYLYTKKGKKWQFSRLAP